MNNEYFDKVQTIITEKLSVDKNQVTPTANFIEDLGADSLDTVELVMALEEAYNLDIPDDQAEKLRTVQDVVNYIEKAVKEAEA
ncbi:MAG: acyl carrier protein [Candidatus Riflebacteria bacterium]|nr:acyl carrier protein [Candidatus Riflebacteria bacterium]